MKVVLDTNVVISGIFFSGHSHEILKAWRDGRIQIVVSPDILDEYYRVAKQLIKRFPLIEPDPMLTLITANSELVQAPKLPTQVCEDPGDDKFLACALAGKSKVIISGDNHLLKVSGYGNVLVLSPHTFVEQYLGDQR